MGKKHDFENISYGNRTMLNDRELLALDQGTGALYKINTITGKTQITFTIPVNTSSKFNPKRYWMQTTKNAIAILDNANGEKTPQSTLYFLNKKNFKLQQTVILTGTPYPAGTLRAGDEAIVHVDGIGSLRNVVVSE